MSCLNPCGLVKLPFGAGAMTTLGAVAVAELASAVASVGRGMCVCVEEIKFCTRFLGECGLCLKLYICGC